MGGKIRFEVVISGVGIPLTRHDIPFLDEEDCREKPILIGCSIELAGKRYEVVNHVAMPAVRREVVYYLQEVR